MDRTIKLLLAPTPEQEASLATTTGQFTAAFNAVCEVGWLAREKNGVTLHHRTYRQMKHAYPALVSDLHCQARVKATEAIRSALALVKKGRKVSQPRSTDCPPRFNVHTFKVDWKQRTVRLSTVDGRQTIPFRLPEYAARFDGSRTTTADLIRHAGRWHLHVVVRIEPPKVRRTKKALGVDLGLAQPAVTSNGRFLGEGRWREVESRIFRLKRALQQAGTRSAKRHLRNLRTRQARFRRDCDHVVSKGIVAACPPGATIAVENLTDIRVRTRTKHGPQARRLHGWSFKQLRSFIEYKAEDRGCTVAGVNPAHTSQRCSRCGHIARNNRRSRGWFKCRKCGYQVHADLNASRNVAAVYLAGGSMPASGEPPVNRLIVSRVGPQGHSFRHKPSPEGDGR